MPLMCGHLDKAVHITVNTSWRGFEALEYPCRLHILDQVSLWIKPSPITSLSAASWCHPNHICLESFQSILHLTATLNWDLWQFNIKTTFLHGILPKDKTVYMEQPPGFAIPGKEEWVMQLMKSIYGMKQSGIKHFITPLHSGDLRTWIANGAYTITAHTQEPPSSLCMWMTSLPLDPTQAKLNNSAATQVKMGNHQTWRTKTCTWHHNLMQSWRTYHLNLQNKQDWPTHGQIWPARCALCQHFNDCRSATMMTGQQCHLVTSRRPCMALTHGAYLSKVPISTQTCVLQVNSKDNTADILTKSHLAWSSNAFDTT